MKSPQDPRHLKRRSLLEELFSTQFHEQTVSEEAKKILTNKETLDEAIKTAAPEFPVEKINKIDLAILRLAMYELLVSKKTPKKVVIDEAIELAKEYGGETSPAFVNGALGHISENEK